MMIRKCKIFHVFLLVVSYLLTTDYAYSQFRDSSTYAVPTPSGKRVKITQLYLNTDTTSFKTAGGIVYKSGYLYYTDGSTWIKVANTSVGGSVGNADSLGSVPASGYVRTTTDQNINGYKSFLDSIIVGVNSSLAGIVRFEGGNTGVGRLTTSLGNQNRTWTLPDQTGTIIVNPDTTTFRTRSDSLYNRVDEVDIVTTPDYYTARQYMTSLAVDTVVAKSSGNIVRLRDTLIVSGNINGVRIAGNEPLYTTFVGFLSGINNTGESNVGFGEKTLYLNQTGTHNTAIGTHSMWNNISGRFNTAVGHDALFTNTNEQNTAVGYQSLKFNTTGDENTAVGNKSLTANTTGDFNTSMGSWSMRTNTTGSNNTAIGYYALSSANASNNTAVGMYSLFASTSGTNNVAIGYNALQADTSGSSNVSIGSNSMLVHTSGAKNVAIGANSLLASTIGTDNVALGYNSGTKITTGTANTFLGYQAGHSVSQLASVTNSIAIGNDAYTTASNQVVLGDASVTSVLLNQNGTASLASGAITATGSISPSADGTYDLGLFNTEWDSIYTEDIIASKRLMARHTTDIADGIVLQQTTVAGNSPRLYFENISAGTGSGVSLRLSAANTLTLAYGATAGTSTGTTMGIIRNLNGNPQVTFGSSLANGTGNLYIDSLYIGTTISIDGSNNHLGAKGVFTDSLRIDELGVPITKAVVDSNALEFTANSVEYRAMQTAYAKLYHDTTTAYSIALGTADSFYTIKNWNQSLNIRKNASITDSSIIIRVAGVYQIYYSISSGSSSASTVLKTSIFRNFNRVGGTSAEQKISTANDIGDMSAMGFLYCSAGDYIQIRVRRESGAGSCDIYNAQLVVTRID